MGELLIADDDQAIVDMLERLFRPFFLVRTARDGHEARELLKECFPVAILVDENMPGAQGSEILEEAKRLHPGSIRMLMTANHNFDSVVAAVNQGEIHRFFAKPIRPSELRRAVLALVEKARQDDMLRREVEMLSRLRSYQPSDISLLLVGDHDGMTRDIRTAALARGYNLEVETDVSRAPALITKGGHSALLLLRAADVELEALAILGRTIDETVSIIVLDPEPGVEGAMTAFSLGATDFFGLPLPPPAELASRLERAVTQHVSQKERFTLTHELLLTNRELELARKKTEEQNIQVLNAIVGTLEARDAYTAGHTDRVAAISVRLGRFVGLSSDELEHVRIGALVHDIGKIGIRDQVLLKPGRLDRGEFELIKSHTTIGSDLLQGIEQFQCALPMIRHHHEKLDGSGYPDGLMGDEIPVGVRVVSVADVMDAITSTRPYRRASAVEESFEIMSTMVGHHLDGDLVSALHELHRQDRLLDLLQDPKDH
jgi:response regulator RpfG family c-di-GMP phosphodiesterase